MKVNSIENIIAVGKIICFALHSMSEQAFICICQDLIMHLRRYYSGKNSQKAFGSQLPSIFGNSKG